MNDSRPIVINHGYKVNHLKSMRIRAGLTQKELAKRAEIPLKSLGNYEQGYRDLNHARGYILLKLAKALNCTIEDLLTL